MKIKERLSKKKEIAIIDIEKYKLNYEKTIEILNLFEFENIILIVDSVKKNNKIFDDFKTKNIKYETIIASEKSEYIQCAINLPKSSFNILSELSILNNDLYFVSFNNSFNEKFNLYDILNPRLSKLINSNIDATLDIWNTEQSITLKLNTKKYDYKFIIDKLESILKN